MEKYRKYYVYFLLFLAVSFWGISYVWTKITFEFYGPVTIMLIRLTISSAIIFTIIKVKKIGEKIDRKDYKAFFILSFFTPFCYFLGENFGLLYVSPTVAAVIISTIPVFAPIFGYIAFREKVNFINILGFLISFAGVLIMILDTDYKFSASPLGIGLLLFAVLSALINIVYLKKLTVKYSSMTIIAVQNLLGGFMFLIVFLIIDYKHFVTTRPSIEAVGALIALAVFGSTLAFLFYTAAVRRIGIARTSIFTNLIPVITTISALLILKESIEMSKVIGMAIVIAGLLMAQVTKLKRNQAKNGS